MLKSAILCTGTMKYEASGIPLHREKVTRNSFNDAVWIYLNRYVITVPLLLRKTKKYRY